MLENTDQQLLDAPFKTLLDEQLAAPLLVGASDAVIVRLYCDTTDVLALAIVAGDQDHVPEFRLAQQTIYNELQRRNLDLSKYI